MCECTRLDGSAEIMTPSTKREAAPGAVARGKDRGARPISVGILGRERTTRHSAVPF